MRKLHQITVLGVRLVTVILIIYWVALFTGTHMSRPPTGGVKVSDKVLHFSAFFGLATLMYLAVPARRGATRKVLTILLIAVPYAAVDEWTQGLTKSRTVDINDFVANTLGILAATAFYLAYRLLRFGGVFDRTAPQSAPIPWHSTDRPIEATETNAATDARHQEPRDAMRQSMAATSGATSNSPR